MQNALIFIFLLFCVAISSFYLKSQEKDLLSAVQSGRKILWCKTNGEYYQFDKTEVYAVSLSNSIWFTVEGEKKDCNIK